jgi:serine/threonine-protein kinase ULK/ATG1
LQDKLGPKGQETLKKEVDITKLLNHPNIVRLIDYIRTENNNYLVFEYCGGGDLRGFLKSKSRLTEPVAQRFMRQIGDALKYLYTNNIIHRDLKPQNIMLTEKVETATLKLADFGLAKRY